MDIICRFIHCLIFEGILPYDPIPIFIQLQTSIIKVSVYALFFGTFWIKKTPSRLHCFICTGYWHEWQRLDRFITLPVQTLLVFKPVYDVHSSIKMFEIVSNLWFTYYRVVPDSRLLYLLVVGSREPETRYELYCIVTLYFWGPSRCFCTH
jgi:hypothetical protein